MVVWIPAPNYQRPQKKVPEAAVTWGSEGYRGVCWFDWVREAGLDSGFPGPLWFSGYIKALRSLALLTPLWWGGEWAGQFYGLEAAGRPPAVRRAGAGGDA